MQTLLYFVLFEGRAEDPSFADDPGEADEDITGIQWTDVVPAGASEFETAEWVVSVVRERFDWFDE